MNASTGQVYDLGADFSARLEAFFTCDIEPTRVQAEHELRRRLSGHEAAAKQARKRDR